MPVLHRYFGTPVTTWILNLLYRTHFSDIHCGMRAITRDALVRMDLGSESWQYASEMVLKSVHMKLRTAEVPVRFFKDPEGRLSHHKRSGWLSPWKAGWSNLEVMLTHGAEFFTIWPGLVLTALGRARALSNFIARSTVIRVRRPSGIRVRQRARLGASGTLVAAPSRLQASVSMCPTCSAKEDEVPRVEAVTSSREPSRYSSPP